MLSPEFESPVINKVEDPVIAVGEFFYSPESWKQGLDLIATVGKTLGEAVKGTIAVANMIENSSSVVSPPVNLGGPK